MDIVYFIWDDMAMFLHNCLEYAWIKEGRMNFKGRAIVLCASYVAFSAQALGIAGLWGINLGDKIDLNLTMTDVMSGQLMDSKRAYVSVRRVEFDAKPTINGLGERQSFYTPISGECWKIGAYSSTMEKRAEAETLFTRVQNELEKTVYAVFGTDEPKSLGLPKAEKRITASFNHGSRYLVISMVDRGLKFEAFSSSLWVIEVELYCPYYMEKLFIESNKLALAEDVTSVFGKRFGVALNADDQEFFVPERKFYDFSKYYYTLTPKFRRVSGINAVAVYHSVEEAQSHVIDVIRILEQRYGRKMYLKYYAPALSNWIMPIKYDEYGSPNKWVRLWLGEYLWKTQYSASPGLKLEFVDKTVTDTSSGVISERDAANINAL